MAPSGNSQSYLRSSQEGNMKNQGFPDYIQSRKKNLSIEWNSATVVGEIGADLKVPLEMRGDDEAKYKRNWTHA